MSRRSTARQAALQVLFEDDFNLQRSRDLDRQYIRVQVQDSSDLADFAWWLIDGTRLNKEAIDSSIETAAENWSVYRMSAVDRNVIRMATFECRFGDTPKPVAIDEAVNLAKRFGGKESPAFINGILDQMLPDSSLPAGQGSAAKELLPEPAGGASETAPASGPSEKSVVGKSIPNSGLKRFIKRNSVDGA